MNFKRVWFVILQIALSLTAFSQIDSTLTDSIHEIIIYEYDTIYFQPDTIRISDTIVDIIQTDTVKEKELTITTNSNIKFRSFVRALVPKSFGIAVAPFIVGRFKEEQLSDSISLQSVLNLSYTFQINYYSKKYLFSIGAAYTQHNEKQSFQKTYYSSSADIASGGSYDSLLINKEYKADYYYNYLNLNVLFGRKWDLNKKLLLSLSVGCSADFLMDYTQGNTGLQDSSVRKFDISIGFVPQLSYRIHENFELKLAPFYQYSLLDDKINPHTFFQKTGIGIGFNVIF